MSLRWNDAERTLDLGVRDLIEVGDRRARVGSTMSDRARLRAGAELHRVLQEEAEETEVGFRHSLVVREWTCTIHGRADLVVEEGGRTVVEEIKSTLLEGDALGVASTFPAWERQLALYVCFAAAARRPDPIGRLRVVSLVDGAERIWTVPLDPGLEAWIRSRLDELVRAREERLAWAERRRTSPVHFAHDATRPGQAEAIDAVEGAVGKGRHLLLVAPTGVGKTAAVLAGVLRGAAPSGARVWWVTARNTQQRLVEETAREMARRGTPLRTVTLRAREKACRDGDSPCVPAECPRLEPRPDATEAALDDLRALGQPDADTLGAVAARHRLCPHALAQEWALRCDLVIADYNYAFDPEVRLRALLADAPRVVVVEEAHQLPDRAVEWGSPSIDTGLVNAALDGLPDEARWRPFRALALRVGEAIVEAELLSTGEGEDGVLRVEANLRRWMGLRDELDELGIAFAALRSTLPPDSLFSASITGADRWIDLGRAVGRFTAALARAGEETVALWSPGPRLAPGTSHEGPGGRLALSCRDPSPTLGPAFAEAAASISISATLAPTWFYRDRCGMVPDRVDELEVEYPFPPENRRVLVVGGVSTALQHRLRDRDAVAEIIVRTLAAVPGNAAVFFNSFDHLREVAEVLPLPEHEVLTQSPAMDEDERARLLARMRDATAPRRRAILGVLGGLFSEGVDLPGDALRAVIVVGPALPPPSFERRLLQEWYEDRFGDGFTLAYVVPGMTRVVQAGGRVVRGPDDRGLVVLVCQRFLRHAYQHWLPAHWSPERARRPWEDAEAFFATR